MSEEKSSNLLNKKRQKEENDEESESSSEDNGKQRKLFEDTNETGFKGGLFGDLANPKTQPQKLFGSGSLFGNNGGSLFSEKSESLFSKNSTLFDFNAINKKKKEDEDDEEDDKNDGGDDDNIGSASPNHYNPEEQKNEEKGGFKKIFVKKIENFYLFNKEPPKYTSHGEGFISIETNIDQETQKRFAVVMFRNNIGNVISEGILNDKFNKFTSYEKKFKHVANYYFCKIVEGKVEGGNAKIPFIKEEDCKAFGDKYNEAINFLKETEEKKEEKKEEEKKEEGKKEEKKEEAKEK